MSVLHGSHTRFLYFNKFTFVCLICETLPVTSLHSRWVSSRSHPAPLWPWHRLTRDCYRVYVGQHMCQRNFKFLSFLFKPCVAVFSYCFCLFEFSLIKVQSHNLPCILGVIIHSQTHDRRTDRKLQCRRDSSPWGSADPTASSPATPPKTVWVSCSSLDSASTIRSHGTSVPGFVHAPSSPPTCGSHGTLQGLSV